MYNYESVTTIYTPIASNCVVSGKWWNKIDAANMEYGWNKTIPLNIFNKLQSKRKL